jgi:hypothetical protein
VVIDRPVDQQPQVADRRHSQWSDAFERLGRTRYACSKAAPDPVSIV